MGSTLIDSGSIAQAEGKERKGRRGHWGEGSGEEERAGGEGGGGGWS